MGDMISQAEIDALLGGFSSSMDDAPSSDSTGVVDKLTAEQSDILGEIGNISMGSSATTLFTLLGQKVNITTPQVKVISWKELAESYERPCVGTRIDYKEGIKGANILVLKELDVKIIANLMMGGDGTDTANPLTEIDLSAIGEAMNQMVGSSSTSLSQMIKKKVDILPPHSFIIDFNDSSFFENIGFGEDGIVCTTFRMEIGTLIDSEIMQILPIEFALDMVKILQNDTYTAPAEVTPPPKSQPAPQAQPQAVPQQMAPPPQQMQYAPPPQGYDQNQMYAQPQYMPPPQQQYYQQPMPQQQQYQPPIQNVQSAQFQPFDVNSVMQQKENMGIIMDVPLEVTVELGRTQKLIREILEFTPGTIIELDKLSGEPIDIYVNGKYVAKGEVVVIDENFGIRISDIVNVENRI